MCETEAPGDSDCVAGVPHLSLLVVTEFVLQQKESKDWMKHAAQVAINKVQIHNTTESLLYKVVCDSVSPTVPARPPPSCPNSQCSVCRCHSPAPAGDTGMGDSTPLPALQTNATTFSNTVQYSDAGIPSLKDYPFNSWSGLHQQGLTQDINHLQSRLRFNTCWTKDLLFLLQSSTVTD